MLFMVIRFLVMVSLKLNEIVFREINFEVVEEGGWVRNKVGVIRYFI